MSFLFSPSTSLVTTSTQASIVIQFLTGILGFYGLQIQIPQEGKFLQKILKLEMIVQLVEFIFYLVLVYIAHIHTMTLLRYGDWLLSTPTMLFTMASYFLYSTDLPPNTLEDVWNNNKEAIILIWIANFGMLLFGFLGELEILSKNTSFLLGSISFIISFFILHQKFAKDSYAKKLYIVMFSTWSLYGVAFLQSVNTKNILYNGLDILAKNFFGVYLSYNLWKKYA